MNTLSVPIHDAASRPAAETHVQEVVRRAEEELRELLERRAALVRRIGSIKQTLVGLANLYGDSVLSPELQVLLDRRPDRRQRGLTQACRSILMGAAAPLTARGFCAEMERGYPGLLENHKDPVASVTTVLNRLVSYAEARTFINTDGRRAWSWMAETAPDHPPADLGSGPPVRCA